MIQGIGYSLTFVVDFIDVHAVQSDNHSYNFCNRSGLNLDSKLPISFSDAVELGKACTNVSP